MNLKNYTSTVPAQTSISRIIKALVIAGATDINQKFDNGKCIAITFRILINLQPMFFKLPAKVDTCFDALWKEIRRPREDTKAKTMDQAERTAWKIVSDWVDIQLTMILLEQAEAVEIFLPYVYDPTTDKTFFAKLKDQKYKGLLQG